MTSAKSAAVLGSSLLLSKYYLTSPSYHWPLSVVVTGVALGFVMSGAMESFLAAPRTLINSLGSRVLVFGLSPGSIPRDRERLRSLLGARRLVGCVDCEADGHFRLRADQQTASFESLAALLAAHPTDEILQIGPCPGLDHADLPSLCAVRGLTYRSLLKSPLATTGRYTTERVSNGEYIISLRTVPEPGTALAVKRVIDIIGALVGLVVCGIVYLFYARRIRRETGGTVFFKQTRVGRNGRRFLLYKFRTMDLEAEQQLQQLARLNEMRGCLFKMRNDPRITPLGRFLRAHHLDELPQCWNVLKGEMSLIGTRPPTPSEVADYQPHHLRRLSMKPGIAGLWQLHGNEKVNDFEDVVRLDCRYIDTWSLWNDFKLSLGALVKLFRGSGW